MKRGSVAIGVVAILLFAALVWPSRWRYEHVKVSAQRAGQFERGPGELMIRIDRLSGEVYTMVPGMGWVHQGSLGASPLSATVERLMQEDEAAHRP